MRIAGSFIPRARCARQRVLADAGALQFGPHREHAEVAGAVLDAHVRATRQFARRAVVRAFGQQYPAAGARDVAAQHPGRSGCRPAGRLRVVQPTRLASRDRPKSPAPPVPGCRFPGVAEASCSCEQCAHLARGGHEGLDFPRACCRTRRRRGRSQARRRTASAGAPAVVPDAPPRPRGRAGWRGRGRTPRPLITAALCGAVADASQAIDFAQFFGRMRQQFGFARGDAAMPMDSKGNPWPRRADVTGDVRRRPRTCAAGR